MSESAFYSPGLRFSCERCSHCCRKESGFVYLSENDLARLAKALQMDYTAFIKTWCRWVDFGRGSQRLSLREKSNFDCIFWDNACSVYESRPLQCRAFPFWDSTLSSAAAWEKTGESCPGINKGKLYPKEEIERLLRAVESEPVIEQELPAGGDS